MFRYNFGKCEPIFKFFSHEDFENTLYTVSEKTPPPPLKKMHMHSM